MSVHIALRTTRGRCLQEPPPPHRTQLHVEGGALTCERQQVARSPAPAAMPAAARTGGGTADCVFICPLSPQRRASEPTRLAPSPFVAGPTFTLHSRNVPAPLPAKNPSAHNSLYTMASQISMENSRIQENTIGSSEGPLALVTRPPPCHGSIAGRALAVLCAPQLPHRTMTPSAPPPRRRVDTADGSDQEELEAAATQG